MTKLHQIIAVVAGKKSRAQKILTDAHHHWKREAISGITKTYTPKDEAGDNLPPESKSISVDVCEVVKDTLEQLADFYDAVATQECANTKTGVDIIVPHTDALLKAPVTVLLFLEKQLVDLHTFALGLPTLPLDREWRFDGNRNHYVTDPIETLRTTKQVKPIVKYHATPEHPAQTDLINEDVVTGRWSTTHLSSAIPVKTKNDIVKRIEQMQDAVKSSRAEANSIEAEPQKFAADLLKYLFCGVV